MPITLLDFIRSGGDFALMGANDIEMANGSRLEAFLAEQLKSLGEADEATAEALSALFARINNLSEQDTELETEVDGIQDAIEEMQSVAEGALGAISGIQQNVTQLESTVEGVQQDVTELQTTVGDIQDSIEEMQGVAEGALGALVGMQQDIVELQQAAAPAKNVDLSKFESEGKIVQTNKDNSTVTYSFGFDENGNLTQITDSKGNVTELIGFAGLGGETYESAEGKRF